MRPTIAGAVLVLGAFLSEPIAFAQTAPPAARPSPAAAAHPAAAPEVKWSTAAAPADTHAKVAPPPKPEPFPPAFRLTISPEWAYRVFRDVEASSTDKTYTANGVFALGGRAELYPLAFVRPALAPWRDFGLTGSYSRAFGFQSHDIDTNTDVDTQWYQFSFGMRYRILGGNNPLAIGFTAGVERWVFDYGTAPPSRPVAVGRYTLLPVGADARYAWGRFSVFGDARFLLPLTISPPGDRTPSGVRWGAHLALAAAFSVFEFLEAELRGAYTMVSYSIPSGMGDAVPHGTIYDQAIVFSAGVTVVF
jgi:hypothetical protein